MRISDWSSDVCSSDLPRSVMHRFADKDALLYAVVDRWLSARLADILAPAATLKDPMERLRGVCREMLLAAVTPHNNAMFRVLLGEVGRLPHMAELVIRSNDMFAVGIERVVLSVQARKGVGKGKRLSIRAHLGRRRPLTKKYNSN